MSNEQKTFSLEDWTNTMPENFDLQAEFVARVQPIINQLMDTCREIGMPLLVLTSIKQDNIGAHIGGFQHFAGPARVPAALMMAMHASKLQYDEIATISEADQERSAAFVKATGSIAGVMASVTKH